MAALNCLCTAQCCVPTYHRRHMVCPRITGDIWLSSPTWLHSCKQHAAWCCSRQCCCLLHKHAARTKQYSCYTRTFHTQMMHFITPGGGTASATLQRQQQLLPLALSSTIAAPTSADQSRDDSHRSHLTSAGYGLRDRC